MTKEPIIFFFPKLDIANHSGYRYNSKTKSGLL